MNPTPSFICLVSCLLLSSCSSFGPFNTHRATCNTLKSDIVFNGATGVTRNADIDNAEAPLQQHMYDRNCT